MDYKKAVLIFVFLFSCGGIYDRCPEPDKDTPTGFTEGEWVAIQEDLTDFLEDCTGTTDRPFRAKVKIKNGFFDCVGTYASGCQCGSEIIVADTPNFPSRGAFLGTVAHEILHWLGFNHNDPEFTDCMEKAQEYINLISGGT